MSEQDITPSQPVINVSTEKLNTFPETSPPIETDLTPRNEQEQKYAKWLQEELVTESEWKVMVIRNRRSEKLRPIQDKVYGALLKNLPLKIDDVSYDKFSVAGMADVLNNVNSVSGENLTGKINIGFVYDLYQTFEDPEKLTEEFTIPGTDRKYTPKDFLQESFWSETFPILVANTIKKEEVIIVHNMQIPESLEHNITHGSGRRLYVNPGYEEDILAPYIKSNEELYITFGVLGFKDPFYDRGTTQGGDGDLQIRFNPKALADRTIYFPHDTGDPETQMDISTGFDRKSIEDRKEHVLNFVDATTLALARHISMIVSNYCFRYQGQPNSYFHSPDGRLLIEANVLGRVPVNPETVDSVVVRPNTKLPDEPNRTTKKEILSSKLAELKIPVITQ